MDWRTLRTVAQDFWRRLPERPRQVQQYFVQYFRLHELTTDLSYRLLKGWRTLHHLSQLAAAQADAEFFGTRMAEHRKVYDTLRRTVQREQQSPHIDVSDLSPDAALRITQRRTRRGTYAAAGLTADLTPAEERQIGGVFSAAWREATKRGEDFYPCPSGNAVRGNRVPRYRQKPRAAVKSRRVLT